MSKKTFDRIQSISPYVVVASSVAALLAFGAHTFL